jgi:threonine dehydrogenase-like Zn-dependent dehydrogenase
VRAFCFAGHEQFCATGRMIGKHWDGGYAEFARIPARSLVRVAGGNPVCPGRHHDVFLGDFSARAAQGAPSGRGIGRDFWFWRTGLSAVQLAKALGAGDVFAVDINPGKLRLAARFGAIPIDAGQGDPVEQIREATQGRGADVALELIGNPRRWTRRCVVWGGLGGRPWWG